jgi:hypothetical protein
MKYILSFIALLSLTSCKKEVDLLHRNDETKFVVWCYLHPDSIVTAYVSKTSTPLSIKSDRTVTDALVVLYENNFLIDTLQNDSISRYKSKKGFKPSVGNIYFIKISKTNFPTLETFPDTMPPKPVLVKYTAEDSVSAITDFMNLARLRLYTDKPQYFESYGISQGKYKYFNFLGTYGDAVFNWETSRSDCDKYYTAPSHSFVKSICDNDRAKDFYEYTKTINTKPQQLRGKKMSLSLCAITKHSAEISYQIGRLGSITFRDNDTELFWTPIYIPETVKNGYGFLMCYNTLNFDVQF